MIDDFPAPVRPTIPICQKGKLTIEIQNSPKIIHRIVKCIRYEPFQMVKYRNPNP